VVSLTDLPADSETGPASEQPTYVLYGGAHRFSRDTPDKMRHLARKWLKDYPWLQESVRKKVEQRLGLALEDFRIDFEDGYGRRSDEEEDAHAAAVGLDLPATQDCKRLGVRIKPLTRGWANRALRTLHLVTAHCTVWPRGFCVTVPKVEEVAQIDWLLAELAELEGNRGPLPLELMVESPRGLRNIEALVAAAAGRCRGVHFGPYDFLASCGVSQGELTHPLNAAARTQLLFRLAGSGVELADGPTTTLPLPPHREPQPGDVMHNHKAVRAAWDKHRDDVLASRRHGFPQSWLLHPAQLISHSAALFADLEPQLESALSRLSAYWQQHGQARATGGDFDDRATARQWTLLLNAAVVSGLISEHEILARLPHNWREV
jgi:citrate lyase beta subunit